MGMNYSTTSLIRDVRRRILAPFVLILAAALPMAGGAAAPTQAQALQEPHIIFILADDLDKAAAEKMPNMTSLIRDQGATFDNYFISDSLCCPSRSTTSLGEYAHNHRVKDNRLPTGGYEAFHSLGREREVIGKELQGTGYQTALFGKYLNGYGSRASDTLEPPPYWNKWFGQWGDADYYR
jgi:arylsulfatase A-like enzyme